MELPITDIRGKGSDGMEKGVAGILGMDFFSRFDVKLDFRSGEEWGVFFFGRWGEHVGEYCGAKYMV